MSNGLIALTLENQDGHFQIELDRFLVLSP